MNDNRTGHEFRFFGRFKAPRSTQNTKGRGLTKENYFQLAFPILRTAHDPELPLKT